ncbi:IS30 family transposase [Jannaschia sp. R86511]|uniref:IS30 family transposase n=1 Tax=Jannaschia sp. R86511 TaxID=3093853 RepID=UPI0036D2C5EC
MAGKGRPGVEPLVEKRELFIRLITAGASNSAACRAVGVNRRTGTRWRYGRSVPDAAGGLLHYPPVLSSRGAAASAVISARYLSEADRIVIGDLHRAGWSSRAIAVQVRRSPSTVSRELARNSGPDGRYGAGHAQRLAHARRRRPRARRVDADEVLRAFVQSCMDRRFSPEQISHALRVQFPGEPARQLVPESVYQALYATNPVLQRTLRTRRWRRRRRPHRRPDARRADRFPTPMVMIEQRPAQVADRVQVGNWEGDLIMGPGNRSAIGTLVERSTRAVMLVHLPAGRTAIAVRDALIAVFSALPLGLRRSLTWDQGKELSAHADLTRTIGLPVFFCDPHSPWQRGSNENMNGLLRDYFPKGTDLAGHSAAHLAEVAAELNNRPRKTLDWASPAQLIAPHLTSSPPPLPLMTHTVVLQR